MDFGFFFYGTLLDGDIRAHVRAHVLGRRAARLSFVPGSLAGYRCVRVAGGAFPGLIEDRQGIVYGIIARGVGRADSAKLVRYEGNVYRMVSAPARTAAGQVLNVRVFLPKSGVPLTDEDWTYDSWRSGEKGRFLRNDCPTHVARKGR